MHICVPLYVSRALCRNRPDSSATFLFSRLMPLLFRPYVCGERQHRTHSYVECVWKYAKRVAQCTNAANELEIPATIEKQKIVQQWNKWILLVHFLHSLCIYSGYWMAFVGLFLFFLFSLFRSPKSNIFSLWRLRLQQFPYFQHFSLPSIAPLSQL